MAGAKHGSNSAPRIRTLLWVAFLCVVGLQALLLLAHVQSVAASRACTAAVSLLASLCCIWRSRHIPSVERTAWWWISAALVMWSIAQVSEPLFTASNAASSLVMDGSDFLYLTAAFPLLLSMSATSEIGSIRGILYLNSFQAVMASVLVYVRLFHTPSSPNDANSVMLQIYAFYCVLLAIAATLRLVTWSTAEERRRIRILCATVWLYLCVELPLDYATKRWNLQRGTLLDLLWSMPFLYAGWQVLHLPLDSDITMLPRRFSGRRGLWLQSLCPLLITAGVFLLAASILSAHSRIAVASMLLLLVVQALQSSTIQLNYFTGQRALLAQEQDLKQANAALEQLSYLDGLTGISNRRHFTSVFEEEWERAARRRSNLAILMIDVDFFKGVNDLHGHTYGDECLVRIAQTLKDALRRGNDLLARYGGEEFILLLPDTNISAAISIAERLKRATDLAGIVNQASPFDCLLTISIGVSAVQPVQGTSSTSLIELADHALYKAKRGGRNQICTSEFQVDLV